MFVRRAFLRRAAGLLLALAGPWRRALATSGEPQRADSLEPFLATLLQRLFPHSDLGEAAYLETAASMAAAVSGDPDLAALVGEGHRLLDQQADSLWLKLPPEQQVQVLQAIEATPFFQTVRGLAGYLFYNNPSIWPFFGYPGSSFEKGGYLTRGFDDLDWLPDPDP
jgi:hypothetical protein